MKEFEAMQKAYDTFVRQANDILNAMRERAEEEENSKKKPTKVLLTIPYDERYHDLPDEDSFTLTDSIRWLLNDGTAVCCHNGIKIEITENGDGF